MLLSYVIVTHNRREALLRTLAILAGQTALPREQWEIRVVDNGSTDGTAEAVAGQFPSVHLLQRPTNEGVWARSYAFEPARGEFVVLLDDDSYPVGDAALLSIRYLQTNPKCAAVVGRVLLPDGSLEACALPAVMLSGAVCLRKSILQKIGPFRREFFRKAGEYDFSFRIWEAGFTVKRFEDIVYRHDKVMGGRSSALAHRMDVRNNLILAERYLPTGLRGEYRRDWAQRYQALAAHGGCAEAARRARWEARLWRLREACTGRSALSPQTIETIFGLQAQERAVEDWTKELGVRSVTIADFSKNLYATYRACRRAGLTVLSIADNHPAFAGLVYRGTPVEPDERALMGPPDGVIVSNINPATIDQAVQRIRTRFAGPILQFWQPATLRKLRPAA